MFPAATGGPEHLRAVHAVFPDIRLCPTGGVSLQNMDGYFAAGAALVGVGNNIVDQRALAAGDRARVIAHARRFLEPSAGRERGLTAPEVIAVVDPTAALTRT